MAILEYLFIGSALATLVISVILFVLSFNRRGKDILSDVFLFWMAISGLNAGLFLFLLFYWGDPYPILIVASFFGTLDPPIAMHFAILLNDNGKRVVEDKKRIPLPWIQRVPPRVIYIPWLLLNLPVLTSSMDANTWDTYAAWMNLYNLLMYIILLALVLSLYGTYRKSTGYESARKMVVSTALFIQGFNGIIQGMTSIFFTSPFLVYTVKMVQIILVPISILLLAYAVLKYDLIKVQRFILKSSFYTLVSVGTVLIFVSVGELAEQFITMNVLGSVPISNILAAMIVAVLFSPLEKTSKKVVQRLFPHKIHDENYQMKVNAYASAYKAAWADGMVSEKEKNLLKSLQIALDLDDDSVNYIEKKMNEHDGKG